MATPAADSKLCALIMTVVLTLQETRENDAIWHSEVIKWRKSLESSPSAFFRLEQSSGEAVYNLDTSRLEDIMNKLAISFAVGASALFTTAATAAPLIAGLSVSPDSNIQNVRMVCNDDGRCWRERGDRRVIIRDAFDYDAARDRYIERRGYEERGGIGFRAPGVSVGIGTDRY